MAKENPESRIGEVPQSFWKDISRVPREHSVNHSSVLAGCPGCAAKAKHRKHFRGALDKGDPKHANTITMDQVQIHDLEGTLGVGGYTYGLVLEKVSSE